MKIAFYTLGCKVNNSETEAIRRQFIDNGWEVVPFSEAADVYVVNTCAVTSMAEAKSRKAVMSAGRRQMTDDRNKPIVAVVGCGSEISREKFKADIVLGTEDRERLFEKVKKKLMAYGAPHALGVPAFAGMTTAVPLARDGERTRKIVKIQDGCENFCRYCIIPYARGREKSRSMEEILDEIREKPSSEVVLVGIHVSSWQMADDRRKLGLLDLVEEVLEIDGVHRVRLGSLEPHDFLKDKLYGLPRLAMGSARNDVIERIEELCEKGLCPHFHISLQSGCDSVLKRMGRKYTFGQFYEIVKKLQEAIPNVAITTDVIVGFGGESDAEFRESFENIKKCGFAKIHIFPYSEREGTAGAEKGFIEKFGSVDKKVRKERAREVQAYADWEHREFLERQVGTEQEIIWERNGGYTPNYVRVEAKGEFESGDIVKLRIESCDGDKCYGSVVK